MEAEDEKNMEHLSSVPSAISEPRGAPRMSDKKCRAEVLKFFEIASVVSDTINFCRKCYKERRLKQGEEEVNGVMWRAMIEQKSFREKYGQRLVGPVPA